MFRTTIWRRRWWRKQRATPKSGVMAQMPVRSVKSIESIPNTKDMLLYVASNWWMERNFVFYYHY